MNGTVAIWGIAALATAGVVVRPWNLPEAIWAVAGALLLVAFGLLPWRDAVAGAAKGSDVYLFLIGMMLLAELAAGRPIRLACRESCASCERVGVAPIHADFRRRHRCHGLPLQRCDRRGSHAGGRRRRQGRGRQAADALISLSALSSPTPRASCSRFQIRQTS